MAPLGLNAVRYGIPLVLFVAGVVVAGSTGSLAAGALFMSAATAVLLLNVLYRMGVQGDRDRDREEEARRYFDEHGRWPDEPEGAVRRRPR
jgi:sirohydrochlorin ferrochelatase